MPELALRFYAVKRTKNQKGVTIPSQIRYVMYFARWLRMERGLQKTPKIPPRNFVLLQSIRIMGIPTAVAKGKDLTFKLIANDGSKFSSKGRISAVKRVGEDYMYYQADQRSGSSVGIASLDQDVLITFEIGGMFDTKKAFSFWFNTRFIGMMERGEAANASAAAAAASSASASAKTEEDDEEHVNTTLVLTKGELDKACRDTNHSLYADTFRIELVFTSA
jgi:hypothetical protein